MQFYINGNLYGSIPARDIQQNIGRNVLLMFNEIAADLINMFRNDENDIIEDNERNINTLKTQLKEIKKII